MDEKIKHALEVCERVINYACLAGDSEWSVYSGFREAREAIKAAQQSAQAIAKERDAANQRVAVLERERDELQKLPFTHGGPEDCPCWYDYCHCNVDTLRDQIKRAAQAEADARELVDYADKSIIADDVDFASRKMERITALIEKYAK